MSSIVAHRGGHYAHPLVIIATAAGRQAAQHVRMRGQLSRAQEGAGGQQADLSRRGAGGGAGGGQGGIGEATHAGRLAPKFDHDITEIR